MLASRPLNESIYTAHIVRRLEQLGYRRPAGMHLVYRYSSGTGYSKLVRELLEQNCDLIINAGTASAASALREAQVKGPIVFLAVNYDPVRGGVVSSLRRPGGNTTGVYLQLEAIATKHLEILRDIFPGERRFAVLTDRNTKEQLDAVKIAASVSGISLEIGEFDAPSFHFGAFFERAKRSGAAAIQVLGSPAFAEKSAELGLALMKSKFPAIGFNGTANAVLVVYAADPVKVAQRTADMAARILKGASPAETPVELADEFDFVVNLKTAKSLDVKVPYSVLARATRIIE